MNKWVVISNDKHIRVDDLDKASDLVHQLLKQNGISKVKLIRLDEYLASDSRKRKRGKNS